MVEVDDLDVGAQLDVVQYALFEDFHVGLLLGRFLPAAGFDVLEGEAAGVVEWLLLSRRLNLVILVGLVGKWFGFLFLGLVLEDA